jgi:glycosyltransferase involved in cell wall biosynthesis
VNILQICPDSYGISGGVSAHVRNISERLAKNHNVTVYATNARSTYPWFELTNGVRIERFGCLAPNDAYFFSPDMLLRLREVKFDVVHAHGYHAFPMHFSPLAKCGKLIITPHFHGVGHTPFRDLLLRLLKVFGKRVLTKANKIVAVSEYEKSLLRQEFGFDSGKIVVVPNGVDFGEFSGLRRKPHRSKSILYVGFLTMFKGPQYLVEVMPKLADDIFLDIVGTGPLKPWLEERAKKLRVADRVRFYQKLPRQELVQKYADADVFVLLSTHEAYSLVVAEALAAGTPCIVANASATVEWIDNKSCFGIDVPINLDHLSGLIEGVIHKGIDRKAAAKWMGTKIMDWNDSVKQLESLYSE